MQKDASDDWTVQTLGALDGVGKFLDSTEFLVPVSQYGAASGTYVISNAGTEPTFTTTILSYYVEQSGTIHANFNGASVNNTPSGTNALQFILPYESVQTQTMNFANGYLDDAGTRRLVCYAIGAAGSGNEDRVFNIVGHAGTAVYNNATLASGDSFRWDVVYNT